MPSSPNSPPRIDDTIRLSLDHYFNSLGDQPPHALYDMVIGAVEAPLLAYVMQRYQGNVSHAAKALGITRNTLRKKLSIHGITFDPPIPEQS
jgi:Fis family transcriptional regulator, factor for inversion stimulation protein